MGLEKLLRKKYENRDEGRLGKDYFHSPHQMVIPSLAHCSIAPPFFSTFVFGPASPQIDITRDYFPNRSVQRLRLRSAG